MPSDAGAVSYRRPGISNGTENGVKQPYYFSAAHGGVLSMAGLWDRWKDIESGEPLLSCTIIVSVDDYC